MTTDQPHHPTTSSKENPRHILGPSDGREDRHSFQARDKPARQSWEGNLPENIAAPSLTAKVSEKLPRPQKMCKYGNLVFQPSFVQLLC